MMEEVFRAMEELHVCWKRIGPYNRRARREVSNLGEHSGMVVSKFELQVLIYVTLRF